ncbi:hypothetical protein RXV94_04905 [Yeosuana sp. MJ-SS3]|uniref:Glycosyltransferase RgtA/B/C/D-like domain-containing protein n=1 Tax=Gilvirhabdus luticola TaxID=3079858 RepID=A0ABU3U588_9FLAO|nr:hypothetical protein [Yeosuana sp. MJ-SS3]MDU8885491.1 hypothetical protein [Yeosuana sp. MJ-SS3]
MILNNNYKNHYLWFSFVALVVVLLQSKLGIRYSYDSNWYIIFANRISENLDFTHQPVYAPLYSWSLGFLNLIGLSTILSILVYWWVSYFFILIGFYLLLKNIGFSVLGLFVVLSNLTVSSLFRFVWTELGYSVLLIFSVLSLYKLINSSNKNYKVLFLLSISLLPLQRYIGGFISVYLGLIYLFFNNKNILKKSFELFLATIPISTVVIWNLFVSGFISGKRKSATSSLIDNLKQTLNVLYHNFSPEWLIFIFICFVIIILITKKKKISPILFFIFFTPIIQVCAQIYSNSTYSIDAIQPRYFIVITPLIVLLLMLFLNEIFKKKHAYFQYYSFLLFFILVSCNLFTINKRHHSVNSNNEVSYKEIKRYINTIPEDSKIGVFAKNTICRQAELILTSKIIPITHCQNYKINGDYITEDLIYTPTCNNLKGHVYVPINYDSKIKPNYIIIDKIGLSHDWKMYFKNYNIVDLGSFFGLIKSNL